MAPKKVTNVEKPKRKIIMTTVELKKELITKWKKGTRVSNLAVQYSMAKLTISTILKNREAIKAADVVKGVKSLTSKRLPAVEEVEKLLWFGLMKNSWLVIVCLRLFQKKKNLMIGSSSSSRSVSESPPSTSEFKRRRESTSKG